MVDLVKPLLQLGKVRLLKKAHLIIQAGGDLFIESTSILRKSYIIEMYATSEQAFL